MWSMLDAPIGGKARAFLFWCMSFAIHSMGEKLIDFFDTL